MNKAMTMLELVVVIGVVGIALMGLLVSYINSLSLSDYDKNLTIAMNIAREKMEELYTDRVKTFDTLGQDLCGAANPPDCIWAMNGNTIVVSFNNTYMKTHYPGFNGSCTAYIKDIDPLGDNLKEVRIVVCWRQGIGRIIGEDTNLNGALDPGEDSGRHANELDSPCEIISAFAKR